MTRLISQGNIENKILLIRGQRVMIDRDLADSYEVQTKYLNRQVKRNMDRFPREFMFRISKKEKNELVTNWHQLENLKYSTALPYVFTEHGVTMLATVLNSEVAVKISILIVKTFIRLRHFILNHKKLAVKLGVLESRVDKHDEEILSVIEIIKQLIIVPQKPKRKIGFSINQ